MIIGASLHCGNPARGAVESRRREFARMLCQMRRLPKGFGK
nr:hypothetical protein [Sphingomonas laterariae]